MELWEWLGAMCGGTLKQEAFYRELFRNIFENGRVGASEMMKWGWHRRSVEEWRRRLVNLEIIQQRREGFRGKVYYEIHPQFYANTVKLMKVLKKIL